MCGKEHYTMVCHIPVLPWRSSLGKHTVKNLQGLALKCLMDSKGAYPMFDVSPLNLLCPKKSKESPSTFSRIKHFCCWTMLFYQYQGRIPNWWGGTRERSLSKLKVGKKLGKSPVVNSHTARQTNLLKFKSILKTHPPSMPDQRGLALVWGKAVARA